MDLLVSFTTRYFYETIKTSGSNPMFELKLANGHCWVHDANDVAIKHQLDGGYSITGPYQSKLPTCGAVLWLYVSKPTWQITYVMAAGQYYKCLLWAVQCHTLVQARGGS